MQPSFRRPALGLALALLPTTLAAQKQFNLPGNHVAVYNLAGEVTVVAGTGSSVGVRFNPGAASDTWPSRRP